MSADIRPAIFVSATSRDLGSCRRTVKESLLSLGCVPVEQQNFPPDAGSVRQMLRARLRTCHAVIHLAGLVYGSEPTERSSGEPRRSYTQLEVDIAHELRVPVYVFICSEDFPYDAHQPEPEALRQLQWEHRLRLTSRDGVYESVPNLEVLERRVLMLQDRVSALRNELARSRRAFRVGLGVAATALVAMGIFLFLVSQRTAENTRSILSVRTELDRQREHIQLVADAYMRLQSELRQSTLTPGQLWARAIDHVAEREGIDRVSLAAGIELFIAATRRNPSANLLDLALADLAERDFASSADNARRAAEAARIKRLAAEKLAEAARGDAQAARIEECAALVVQGKALTAGGDFERAVSVLDSALSIMARGDSPMLWAEIQFQIGVAELEWARRTSGEKVANRNLRAVSACRAALEVYDPEKFPAQWALAQNNLAIALQDRAAATVGPDRLALLAEAVSCHRSILALLTRERAPQDWAMTLNNLANALSMQAEASPWSERAQLLDEVLRCYRLALEVRTREEFPQDWATHHNNLSIALMYQASMEEGSVRDELLAESAKSLVLALEIFTRQASPQDWAMTQANLASLQSLRAQIGAGDIGVCAGMLEDAAARYRLALEVYTREGFPQHWSGVQHNLAGVLIQQAASSLASDQAALFAEAVRCCELALEVRSQESTPVKWAKTQRRLAHSLLGQGNASVGPTKLALIRKSIAAFRRCVDGLASMRAEAEIDEIMQQIAELEAAFPAG
jgi:tetratricopeptide (TPR) repeat protein